MPVPRSGQIRHPVAGHGRGPECPHGRVEVTDPIGGGQRCPVQRHHMSVHVGDGSVGGVAETVPPCRLGHPVGGAVGVGRQQQPDRRALPARGQVLDQLGQPGQAGRRIRHHHQGRPRCGTGARQCRGGMETGVPAVGGQQLAQPVGEPGATGPRFAGEHRDGEPAAHGRCPVVQLGQQLGTAQERYGSVPWRQPPPVARYPQVRPGHLGRVPTVAARPMTRRAGAPDPIGTGPRARCRPGGGAIRFVGPKVGPARTAESSIVA